MLLLRGGSRLQVISRRLNSRHIVPRFSSVKNSEDVHPDGLTRYPGFSSANATLRSLDWLGTISFASSGTVTAGMAGITKKHSNRRLLPPLRLPTNTIFKMITIILFQAWIC